MSVLCKWRSFFFFAKKDIFSLTISVGLAYNEVGLYYVGEKGQYTG